MQFFISFDFGKQHSFARNDIDSNDDGYCSAVSQTLPGKSLLWSNLNRKQSSFAFIRSNHCCCSKSNIVFFTNLFPLIFSRECCWWFKMFQKLLKIGFSKYFCHVWNETSRKLCTIVILLVKSYKQYLKTNISCLKST